MDESCDPTDVDPASPEDNEAITAEVVESPPQPAGASDWISAARLKALDPRHVTVERIAGWIFLAVVGPVILIAGGGVVVANWPPGWAAALAALGVFVLLSGLIWSTHVWPAIAYRRYRYMASEEGLEIYRGVVWRSIISVPRSRIQHTDVRQGPLQRRFGLGKLVVHTAGTQHAAIELDGLSREEALALRDLLTAREDDDDAI